MSRTANPLEHVAMRTRLLEAIRATGVYLEAYALCGITRHQAQRYKANTPDFAAICDQAKHLHKVEQLVTYRGSIKANALALLDKRIADGTISEMALLKIIGFEER